jgi:hypothetical protein
LTKEISNCSEQLAKVCIEGDKHTLAISKHTEQLFKVERELIETKDILKTFMLKYDTFVNDTNTKFIDYENALSEIEKNINIQVEINEPINNINEEKEQISQQISEDTNTINDIDDTNKENIDTIRSTD